MRLAVSRAVAVETSRGWRIAKEKQSHKIDVIVALGMAAHAAAKSPTECTYISDLSWVGGPTLEEKKKRGELDESELPRHFVPGRIANINWNARGR